MSTGSGIVPPPPAVRPSASAETKPKTKLQRIHIKASYRGKSVQMDLEPVSHEIYTWQALKSKLQAAFGICNIHAKYTDDAGDCVNIDSQEEFQEAIKVGNLLGSLNLTVDGDLYNPYVEELHIKLLKPSGVPSVQDEAMDTSSSQSSSPEHSFVEILHSDVPKHPSTQVKFHPYRRTSGCGHYAELARTIGSERRYFSNKHVEAFHNKISKSFEATAEISTKNPYVENLHLRLNKSGGKSQMPPTLARSPVAPAPRKNSPPVVRPPAAATPQESGKNEYVEAIHAKLQQMGRQPVAPSDQWWMTALEKTSDKIIGEVHRGLEGTVEMLVPPTGSAPYASSNALHYNITCDGCEAVIKGSRYKCGNCPDYDLCESCEQWSETIHRPDHVFLKIKIPATRAGVNRKGKLRPLLKRNIYQHTSHSSDEDEGGEIKRCRRVHRQHRHTEGALAMTGGYVTKPKDKLKEEIKMRKKEEKQRAKMESKVEKLGAKLAATSVSSPKPAKGERKQQKGHGKYLDCQFITDTCYPDDSLVPFQVPFEKGWLVMNSGTKKWKHVKLIHTDGFMPLCTEVDVPELKPGERVELVAKYPPITDSSVDTIKSSWRLVHKESTAFGPLLWLQVQVDKAPMIIYPPTTTVPPLTTSPTLPEQSLTNENLLKSIGFIPGDSAPPAGGPSLPAPQSGCASEDEELLTTFDVVETPKESIRSLSSYNSFNQTQPQEFDDIKLDDAASVASDDSDFVVVLPDCFDLDKPLSGFSSLRSSINDPTASVKSHDSQVISQQDTASVKAKPPSHVNDHLPPVGGASPDTARKANFVPERITLKQVKDSRIYNPITMATGLVNTVTDLVDKRVHFGPKKTPPPQDSSSSDSDDDFEDAPEAPSPGPSEATPTEPWRAGQSTDVSQWVKREDTEDMRKWCHNPDVSHLVPLRWDGPKTPATPMERLIGMGFADRQLNARLLEKHHNNLGEVLNELLDNHQQAFGGSSPHLMNV